MKLTSKRLLWSLSAGVALLVGATIAVGPRYYQLLNRVVAYKTKQTAAFVLVCNQPRESAEQEVNEDHPLLRFARVHFDRHSRKVTGHLFGFFYQEVQFREDLGTTLVYLDQPNRFNEFPPRQQKQKLESETVENDSFTVESTPSGLVEIMDAAFTEPQRPATIDQNTPYYSRTRALIVFHKDRILAEAYRPGLNADTRHLGWSMAKSVLGLLTMMRVEEGAMTLDAPLQFGAWMETPNDPRAQITLQHLMTMTSGLTFNEDYGPFSDVVKMLYSQGDMAQYAINKPLTSPDAVGQTWNYSSGSANIVSAAFRQSFNHDSSAHLNYPYHRLFAPLGMDSALLELDAAGTFCGSSYLYATARDWIKIGQLILNQGKWKDQRIIQPKSLKILFTPTQQVQRDDRMGYAALWWHNRPHSNNRADRWMPEVPEDAIFALGHYGQALAIVPSLELIVLRLGSTKGGAWKLDEFLPQVIRAIHQTPI